MKPEPDAALLIVDVQRGFISEPQELPVPGGAEIIPLINRMMPLFGLCIASQDWHPEGHGSFASSHPDVKPFDQGMLHGVPQVFWPDHCVQGSRGAQLHAALDQRHIQLIVRKGMDPRVDSYSAFADNRKDHLTGLDGYLRARKVGHLYICGLALDYCVRYSALDALRLMPECDVMLIKDATRAVQPQTGHEAVHEINRAGGWIIDSSI